LPGPADWGQSLLLFAIFALMAVYLGQHEPLFKLSVTEDWGHLFALAAAAIIVPALAEELVFRVLLAGRTGLLRAGIALAAFVLWHPLQVWLGLPMAQPMFLELAFLAIVALLGAVCTISWRRSGSVWPAVLIHWLSVVAWKGLTETAL